MKPYLFALTSLCLLSAFACSQTLEPSFTKVSKLQLSLSEGSKTYLDGLKVLWNDNDQIAVNGKKSTGIKVSSDARTADFTISEVTAPFYILYPASAYVLGSYLPASEKYGSVTFPEHQTMQDGSFDPSAAMMIGYSSSDMNVCLKHGAAYLKFIITSSKDSHNIKRIEVSANGNEDLSGEYAFNPSSMKLERGAKGGNKVMISAPSQQGVSQGTPICLAIPAIYYASGFKLRIVDAKNHYQDITSAKAFNAEPGVIYKTSISFAPTGTVMDADAPDDMIAPGTTTSVLFIGNSHTLDSTDLLPTLLNNEGVTNIRMTRVYHGAYYLVGWNAYYSKPNNCSIMTWEPGQHYFRGDEQLTYSLQDAVEFGNYDIVVLQEYAGNSHCWTWDAAEKNAISGLISKIKASNPKAEIVYFHSHCFATDYSVLVDKFDNSHVKQFTTCVDNNSAHVMDPAEGFGITRIISTGALIENLRTTGLNDVAYDMMRGDKIHQDYGLTRFAASSLIWKTLFTPLTGIDSDNISYRFLEYYPSASIRSTPVIDENLPAIKAAVAAAYSKPLEITDLSSYSTKPDYVHVPGSVMVDQKGVEVEPVSFPVEFPIGISGGKVGCKAETQPIWNGYGVWEATQQQALAKWVSVSVPVAGKLYRRSFANNASGNLSSVAVDAVWTGDYYEFIIPVKNFAAGTTIRFHAPVYNRYAPVNWVMDYLDGNSWKTAATKIALEYTFTDVNVDMTFQNALECGFLRFRLRCADGSAQTSPDGPISGTTPHMSNGNYDAVFYFWNSAEKAVSFSIVK